ncbi:MAG: 30S ribosomal protein S6 [Gammaproteobacteria bacterium]|nr:30S ribosomal protein S6 [Gammaproteobacteria bacterium]|tara:strand:+ start:8946 stop:9446 length:501 start_codon:yes stop_codon:yes gene_type:complete
MKKYEAAIILNPNLSSKIDIFIKDFEKLLNSNSFNIIKHEDIGRRQLAYSINNHNKGHYLLFNIEGDPIKLIEVENKIKYNESIIRHLFISVKEHSGEESQLLIDSKDKKNDSEEIDNKKTKEVSEKIELKKNTEVDKANSQEKDEKLENKEELDSKDKINEEEDE